jgi:hypothetical protein
MEWLNRLPRPAGPAIGSTGFLRYDASFFF